MLREDLALPLLRKHLHNETNGVWRNPERRKETTTAIQIHQRLTVADSVGCESSQTPRTDTGLFR